MRTKYFLIFLALAHLVLAVLYSNVTPYRQPGYVSGRLRDRFETFPVQKDYGAPDERQHANYVQHLLDGKGFPVFNAQDPQFYESYQSHQPPLFYLLDAGWCKIAGVSDVAAANGVACRYLNAILGAGTVVGVFFLGFWGLGKKEVGLIAAAFVAFLPMMCSLSGALSNDPLLFCLCTWVLALLAKQTREGWTTRETVLVGVLAGCAFLTKTTAVGLLPMIALAGLLPGPKRPRIAFPTLAIGIGSLVVAPWWIRNQGLYGDPLAIQAFNNAFVGSPKTADLVAQNGPQQYWVQMFGWWTIRSFFGVFGYMDIFLNHNGTSYMGPQDPNLLYLILFLTTLVFALAGIRATQQPEAADERPSHLLNFSFIMIVAVLYLRFNLQYFQAQSRYLFPAIAPIAVGIAYGVASLFKNRWVVGLALVVLGLGAVDLYAIGRLPNEFILRGTNAQAKSDLISRMSQ